MKIAIHQPNYIPWTGYFYKICMSDIFVFLDNVQYEKNGFADRNSIKTPQGRCYLKIPVATEGVNTKYNKVRMKDELKWREKHIKTIEMNYKKALYFNQIMTIVGEIYKYNTSILSEFNIYYITRLAEMMGFTTKFITASDLNVEGTSTERLKNIVLACECDIYLSGSGGEKYQNEKIFSDNYIKLEYSRFESPQYRQLWGKFETNLSILDLLFNYGFENAADIIKNAERLG